ncbi:hypothetical protein [Planctomycetes bacterium Poly30]|uniref:hypothetical protein n=1 Tax=Saltatorellus ferox TaxID=2528018 RepID=UPI00119D1E17
MQDSTEGAATMKKDRSWIWLAVITLVALVIRTGMIELVGDATNFRVAEKNPRPLIWEWGYEQGAISQSLADGDGFRDPFLKESGPTAWAAPLYPMLVATLLRITDGPSWSTAVALALIQALSAALTCVFLFRLGRVLHSEALGLLAAAAWALHPMAAYLPVALVWDSTFVALGITWFLANLAESVCERGLEPISARTGAGLGLRFGLVLLVNPAPLALVPMIAAFVALRQTSMDCVRRALPALGGFALAAAAITAPWTVRNALVLGSPNIRTNLGVEFMVGNNDDATGPFNGHLHPAYNADEFARYVELGEVAYSAECRDRAMDWARRNPARFAGLTLERFQRFWIGPDPRAKVYLGMGNEQKRDWQGWIKYASHALAGVLGILGCLLWKSPVRGSAWIPRGTLLLFPAVYYLTHVFERYRFPIEPIVTLAAAALVLRIMRWRR